MFILHAGGAAPTSFRYARTALLATLVAAIAQPENLKADILVELVPGNISSDGLTWTNSGLLGGEFHATHSPALTGDSGVLFDGSVVSGIELRGPGNAVGANAEYFTSAFNAPEALTGNSPRSVEVWVLNPSFDLAEETLVSWGSRGTTGANMAFNYDPSPGHGAVATFNGDAGFEDFSTSPAVPAADQWHHLVYTFDGSNFGLYIDGNSLGTFTPPVATDTAADHPIQVGYQNGPFSDAIGLTATLNSVRIHDRALNFRHVSRAFDEGPAVNEVPYTLEVDRDTGAVVFHNNTFSPLQIVGYSVFSDGGALDPASWSPIAERADASPLGDGSFDDDNHWTILSADGSHTDLSEFELGGGDGGQLAPLSQLVISPGGGWVQSLTEDLRIEMKLDNGKTLSVDATFVGNNDSPFVRGDLNFDGKLDALDWSVLVGHNLAVPAGLSLPQAYQLGDLDLDGDNDFFDFREFQALFDATHGAGALAGIIGGAQVPEPTAALLGSLAAVAVAFIARRRSARRHSHGITGGAARQGLQMKSLVHASIPCFACALAGLLLAQAPATRAAVYPGPGTSKSMGAHTGIYMVIRGTNQPPLTQQRIDEIRASELRTRQFYAASSGGQYDLRYVEILDVPLTLDANNRRIGDWWGDAEQYVRNHYGIEPEAYHANVFDVSATTPDVGQGWSGLAIIPSNNYANQENVTSTWGQQVNDHELGHRIGVPHAGALRSLDDNNYTPYVWDNAQREYVVHDQAVHGHQPMTFGIHHDEYGSPFDVMGNIRHGDFTVHEKLTDLGWLSGSHVRNLNSAGEGVYRLFAHDALTAVEHPTTGIYGADAPYAGRTTYGLTYERDAERFNRDTRRFEPYTQTITLEYRSGRDGVQFYLDDTILDMDLEGSGSDRNNQERELEIGQSIADIDFGMSTYISSGDGDDFLSYNPPAPSHIWEITNSWFTFDVLGLGTNSRGDFVEVQVSEVVLGTPGDLDGDGLLSEADVPYFRTNWLADTSQLGTADQFAWGDLDFSGRVDLDDAWLMAELFADHGLAFSLTATVPEPAAALLLTLAITTAAISNRRGRAR